MPSTVAGQRANLANFRPNQHHILKTVYTSPITTFRYQRPLPGNYKHSITLWLDMIAHSKMPVPSYQCNHKANVLY